jgi:hypothetical protein
MRERCSEALVSCILRFLVTRLSRYLVSYYRLPFYRDDAMFVAAEL